MLLLIVLVLWGQLLHKIVRHRLHKPVVTGNNLILSIFEWIRVSNLVHVDQVGILWVGLVIFNVGLVRKLNLINGLVLLHRVLACSRTDQIFLVFVVLLDFDLSVGVCHQLLSNLVVVYNFTRISLTIVSLYLTVVQVLQLPCALLQSPWIDFGYFRFIK